MKTEKALNSIHYSGHPFWNSSQIVEIDGVKKDDVKHAKSNSLKKIKFGIV